MDAYLVIFNLVVVVVVVTTFINIVTATFSSVDLFMDLKFVSLIYPGRRRNEGGRLRVLMGTFFYYYYHEKPLYSYYFIIIYLASFIFSGLLLECHLIYASCKCIDK